jgi:hypothetical protein
VREKNLLTITIMKDGGVLELSRQLVQPREHEVIAGFSEWLAV